jgi:RNA polymerase sigma-70 factor (ECF subfamily)
MAALRDHARWSDAELLDGIASRDPQAFSAFYRRHLRLVLGTLVRETGDREIAADLTAEVFAAVMVSARRYEPRYDRAGAWLLAIARNVLGHSRRRGHADDRARRRIGMEAIAFHDADLERIDAVLDDGSGVVSTLVGELPAPERSALVARIVEERSYAEIAAAARCSETVARKRVSRGLARLRARMTES